MGIISAPVTALPAVLGICEMLYGGKLLANPRRPGRPSPTIAILEFCGIPAGNAIAMVVGSVALAFYSNPVVMTHFEMINTPAA